MRRLFDSVVGSRPARRRSGDATKTILIVLGAGFGLMFLLCLVGGFAGYMWFRQNFSRIALEDPEEIRKLTAEIVDIEVPPQFTPYRGSAILGMKTVQYQWNPEGKPLHADADEGAGATGASLLMLMEFAQNGPQAEDFEAASADMYSEQNLNEQYSEYTKTERQFDIRGKKCNFTFIHGRQKPFGAEMADESETDAAADKPADTQAAPAEAAPDGAAPATPPATAENATPSPMIRWVTGSFPGKSGTATLTITVPADALDDEAFAKIIQSIR